ncbi:ApaG protein [Chitinivorax tropicus]|uniref:Protein ApaG n=1 Tax=Chitinivorax tropicus TaxID=714531 RepID=A0A840MTM8_9PROT|nr:Co2+/Mg2+ efflux protein ApaG [Chitinivorax tropicus]MBB5019726.1 ApaG protein [Chitinivorax tropicus]
MSEPIKYQIEVTAESTYLEEQSDEAAEQYVFAYRVRMTNTGEVPAKLISRYWHITDATGAVQEVRGLGVIGEQPVIKPGQQFEYTSGVSLNTPVGTMRGSYQMVAEDGIPFEADVPQFVLSIPRTLH